MEIEEFKEAVRRDDFALGETLWLGDWEFEVVNRKSGGKAVEDEVVFWQEQGKEPAATCPGAPDREQEENTGIQNRRQMIVAVAGQRIVDIYESENGRCWYITQRTQRQGQGFVSGYVRCLKAAVLAEFQHLPEEVLQDTGQCVWRVPQEAWWRCPCVDVTEEGAGPTIIRCEGEGQGSRPSPSCSTMCKEVDEKMRFDMQSKLDEYLRLLEQIRQKTTDERTAVAVLQEVSKDRRSAEIREDRETKNGEGKKNSQPATEKQKEFMDKLGIEYPADVTKQYASMLIDEKRGKNGE